MVLFFIGIAVFLKQRNQTPVRVLTEKTCRCLLIAIQGYFAEFVDDDFDLSTRYK